MSMDFKPNGYCIYIPTLFEGPIPILTDGDDRYVIFETELEAQKEIADNAITRLQEFVDGEREYEDAISIDEYVVRVAVNSDGSFADETGKVFGPKCE